tara:strand:- start:200 stop:709 length:510 start_codon:yes stop_codon:yes gene_type:complete
MTKTLEQIQEEIAKENGIPAKYLFAQPDNEGILKRSMRDMKNIKQIQEENRKAIIMANNSEAKSYDEALEMEEQRMIQNSLFTSGSTIIKEYIVPDNFIYGLGKPLTLDRILIALEPYPNNWGIVAGHIAKINRKTSAYDFKCKWDLTKPTLEEQTEDCQRAVHKLVKV